MLSSVLGLSVSEADPLIALSLHGSDQYPRPGRSNVRFVQDRDVRFFNIRGQCKNLLPLYDQIFFSNRRYSGHFLSGLPQIIGNLLATGDKKLKTSAVAAGVEVFV